MSSIEDQPTRVLVLAALVARLAGARAMQRSAALAVKADW